MKYYEISEKLRYRLHDIGLALKCILVGTRDLFKPSAWSWMNTTRKDNGFTWSQVLGIHFFNDYRLKKHWERNGADW